MNKDIISQLQNLGLSSEESELFMFLVSQGRKTVSEIRKENKWSATKTNNVLASPNLTDLLLKFSDNGRNYFITKPLVSLKVLLEKRRKSLEQLRNTIPSIRKQLAQLSTKATLESKVINYHGLTGLEQVLWNSINSKETLRFFVYTPNGKYMDYNFYDDIRRIYTEKAIRTQEIINSPTYPDFTNVPEFINLYEGRYLDSKLIKFKQEVLIYNNVYAIYRIDKNGIFCTEIYNERLAQMQKQLFDYIWKRSQKMKIVSPKGKLVLIPNF